MRCDLNVPLDGKTISDDTRIRASVPTVKYLMENGAKVLLASHLGRPKSGPEDKFSLGPVRCRRRRQPSLIVSGTMPDSPAPVRRWRRACRSSSASR